MRLASVAVIFGTLISSAVESATCQPPSLLWSVDLSKDADFRNNVSGETFGMIPFDLFFLDSDRLVLSFDVKQDVTNPIGGGDQRVVATVDASDGSLIKRLIFPTHDGTSHAVPSDDGGVVVVNGKVLRKYSRDLILLAENQLPSCPAIPKTACAGDVSRVRSTPGNMQVFVQRSFFGQRIPVDWNWVNAKDLSIAKVMSGIWSPEYLQAGNDAVALSHGRLQAAIVTEAGIKQVCEPCQGAYFINDNLLLVSGTKAFQIVDTSGHVVSVGKLSNWVDSFQSARIQPRFVYVTVTGGYAGLLATLFPKLHYQVHLFDWKLMKEIRTWEYSAKESVPGPGGDGVAISPDGDEVALFVDHNLMLYKIR